MQIQDIVQKATDSIVQNGIAGTRDLENSIGEAAVSMCREVLEALLTSASAIVKDVKPAEGERNCGRRALTIHTQFGAVRCEHRDYYYNATQKTGRYPFDDALGLIGSCTPALAERSMRFALKEPYQAASDSIESSCYTSISTDILMRLPRLLKSKTAAFLKCEDSAHEPLPSCVCVMADGTGMPMRRKSLRGVKGKNGRAKTREVKFGAIFNASVDADNDPFRLSDTTTYVGTSNRKDDFAKQLRLEFDRRYSRTPPTTLFIADGAPWLWSIRNTHFPFAVEILDYYHATEHLSNVLDHIELKQKEHKRLLRKWKGWLYNGKIEAFIQEAQKRMKPSKTASIAIGYFIKNKHRMKYKEYRDNGWFIGSGVVESGCKSVLGARFKQPGMFWSKKGLDALLPFRIAFKSDRYTELWNHITKDVSQLKIS